MPDLLLPPTFDERLAKKVTPALQALGVTAEAGELIRRVSNLTAWPVRIRRPKTGSVLVPMVRGKSLRAGDVALRFPDGAARESRQEAAQIERVFGISAQASPAQARGGESVEWEDHPMLAVSTDFITILADILPGKDVFVGVDLWANSMLPLSLMAQRPLDRVADGDQTVGLRALAEGGIKLVATCTGCSGSGNVRCKKCEGHGSWQPEGSCNKCKGARTVACSKCDSGGYVSCRRCNGSGDFIGKRGDRMGDCRSCSGSGRLRCNVCEGDGQQTCYVCKGSGEPPILTCKPCAGSGHQSCFECSGEGDVHVGFNATTGVYFWRDQDIAPEEVTAVSAGSYSLSQGARKFLQTLLRNADTESAQRAAVAAVQHEIAGIDECLEMAMEAGGAARDLLDFRAVQLGAPEATTARMRKRLVLKFPIIKPPAWARNGTEPFAVSTALLLKTDEPGGEVQIKRQSPDPLAKPVDPLFAGLEFSGRRRFFLISFPADIVMTGLPQRMWVLPNLIPPPELAQQKELSRWCIPDEAPGLIAAFTKTASDRPAIVPTVIPIDQELRQNPRQQEALNWMMSDAPLVLIKGPPGTGKTTVITEAVLQSIKRGQKVLICSETHQAVANVLERLQRDGSIRMVRHARADNPRLTEMEKDYLEGGAKQGFLARVREQTLSQVQACHGLRARLAPLPQLLESAHAAAAALETRRYENERLAHEAQNEYTWTREAADRQRTEQIRTLESNRDSEVTRIEAETAVHRQALLKAQADLRKAEKSRDHAADAHRNKTGAAPELCATAPGGWFDLSFLVPNMFATPALLQERLSCAVAEEQAARSQMARCEHSIAEYERNLQECRRHAAAAVQKVQSVGDRAIESAQGSLSRRLQDLQDAQVLADSEHTPPQERASQAWNAAAAFSPAGRDEPPSAWQDRTSELLLAIEKNEEKAAFCERWQKAVETSSQELTGLFWDTTQVFLSTCVGLASWRAFHEHHGKQGVDMVIIDEAAHATLTQTLIPLSRAKRAILIGDEMQLPPAPPMELGKQCVNSCSARCLEAARPPSSGQSFKASMSSCWLERSAFEWLTETRPAVPRVMLNRQFRMHPDIANFIGQVFYQDDGGLENGVTAEARHLAFGEFTKAVCLVSTSAYRNRQDEKPSSDSKSHQNPLEVDLTRRILKQARQALGEAVTFGVITPYAAQKILMEQELGEFFTSGSHVNLERDDIASVDSFQGSERDVMIASFVRSPGKPPLKCRMCDGTGTSGQSVCAPCEGRGWMGPRLDWVHDLRRLNVAFSRARRMLILVGDIEALTDRRYGTHEGAEVLGRFLTHVSDRGRVLHLWEDEDNG